MQDHRRLHATVVESHSTDGVPTELSWLWYDPTETMAGVGSRRDSESGETVANLGLLSSSSQVGQGRSINERFSEGRVFIGE